MIRNFRSGTALLLLILLLQTYAYSNSEDKKTIVQPDSIAKIISSETDDSRRKNLEGIVEQIDGTYTNLRDNLSRREKLLIFFDPAHGKLPDGRWQGGEATLRSSCTNRPEEYYSILLSRALYDQLSKNTHFEVKSTDDFMEVLKGNSNTYENIPFSVTVDLANKYRAFILLSEHLNNVSIIYKASGKMNIPGIHIIHGGNGNKVLRYISDTYSGFLTLYNKLDASGFSRDYALKLKEKLIAEGLRPNSWEFGAVGDSRFSYFVDFPVSVIFESGFISNPHEEKDFRNPLHVEKIARSQYESLLDTIKSVYGVDLSGSSPVYLKNQDARDTELLKLSRIVVYYCKEGETAKVSSVIDAMRRVNGKAGKNAQIEYFTQIKNTILRSEGYYNLGDRNSRRNRHSKARRYYRLAWRNMNYNPIFSTYKRKYAQRMRYRSSVTENPVCCAKRKNRPVQPILAAKSPINRPIILTIEKGQSLESALQKSLSPPDEILSRLMSNFSRGEVNVSVRIKRYSPRLKRSVGVWVTRKRRVGFEPGIYVVSIDKNLNLLSSKRVKSVELNPLKYQNQLYLKNSHFALNEKNKTL